MGKTCDPVDLLELLVIRMLVQVIHPQSYQQWLGAFAVCFCCCAVENDTVKQNHNWRCDFFLYWQLHHRGRLSTTFPFSSSHLTLFSLLRFLCSPGTVRVLAVTAPGNDISH